MAVKFAGIPIDKIIIGERRRADLGDLDALARGIKRVGLLSPIVVDQNGDDQFRLVAGERRLRAAMILRWTVIPAQLRSELTEAELRDIELEENENRKSLTEAERARSFKAAKREQQRAQQAVEVLESSLPKPIGPKGGRPTEPDSSRSIASALGVSHTSVLDNERHVELAEEFPFMQDEAWRQSDVLRIRERLQEFPEQERGKAGAVLACAEILHPKTAVDLLDKLKAQPLTQRNEIYELSRSDDPRDISLALTRAAELPPMPDPRREILRTAIVEAKKAADLYPDDPLTPRIRLAVEELAAIRKAISKIQGGL